MQMHRRAFAVLFASFIGSLLSVAPVRADDWIVTGSGTRVKTVAFVDVNVYDISHYVKKLPPSKSKQAMIELDADKKLVWTMRRDVDKDKIHEAIKNAFGMNAYTDQGKISQFLGAFSGELKEKSHVTILYTTEKKAVTVTVDNGGTSTVEGVDFMKGVWSIWFGKIDQPKLGEQLISKLP